MADTVAVRALERRNERIDAHIRAVLAAREPTAAEAAASETTVSINMLIDGGGAVISTGVVGALRVDFDCIITGSFLQNVDGETGSIELDIDRSNGGGAGWSSIVAAAPPEIVADEFSEDTTLTGWTLSITTGSYLRWTVVSVSTFTRILSVLRVTR